MFNLIEYSEICAESSVLSARTGSKLRGKTSGLCCSLRHPPYFYDLRTKLVNSSFFSRKCCTFAAANLTKLIPNEKKNCFHGCDSHSRHDHLGWRIDD